MELTKPIVALLVTSLLAAGAATAAPGALPNSVADATSATDADPPASVDASATYDNGTVTVTVNGDDGGLAGVDVSVDGEQVGTTDGNGSVTFDAGDADEFEIELEGDGFEGELEYAVQDDALSLLEEEYEYERADEEVEDDEADDEEVEDDEADDEEVEDDEADDEEVEDDESDETEETDDESEDSDDAEEDDDDTADDGTDDSDDENSSTDT